MSCSHLARLSEVHQVCFALLAGFMRHPVLLLGGFSTSHLRSRSEHTPPVV